MIPITIIIEGNMLQLKHDLIHFTLRRCDGRQWTSFEMFGRCDISPASSTKFGLIKLQLSIL
jgi:hypothetical protein